MESVQFVERTHANPLIDVGSMLLDPNFIKSEEVHLLYAIWDDVGEYHFQGWIVG
jgi:hypothetical protein